MGENINLPKQADNRERKSPSSSSSSSSLSSSSSSSSDEEEGEGDELKKGKDAQTPSFSYRNINLYQAACMRPSNSVAAVPWNTQQQSNPQSNPLFIHPTTKAIHNHNMVRGIRGARGARGARDVCMVAQQHDSESCQGASLVTAGMVQATSMVQFPTNMAQCPTNTASNSSSPSKQKRTSGCVNQGQQQHQSQQHQHKPAAAARSVGTTQPKRVGTAKAPIIPSKAGTAHAETTPKRACKKQKTSTKKTMTGSTIVRGHANAMGIKQEEDNMEQEIDGEDLDAGIDSLGPQQKNDDDSDLEQETTPVDCEMGEDANPTQANPTQANSTQGAAAQKSTKHWLSEPVSRTVPNPTNTPSRKDLKKIMDRLGKKVPDLYNRFQMVDGELAQSISIVNMVAEKHYASLFQMASTIEGLLQSSSAAAKSSSSSNSKPTKEQPNQKAHAHKQTGSFSESSDPLSQPAPSVLQEALADLRLVKQKNVELKNQVSAMQAFRDRCVLLKDRCTESNNVLQHLCKSLVANLSSKAPPSLRANAESLLAAAENGKVMATLDYGDEEMCLRAVFEAKDMMLLLQDNQALYKRVKELEKLERTL